MRAKDITSTEVAALFGLSPYLTKFELWHRKKENITADFQANERTLWGNRLEEAIAKASADEKGWIIRKAPEYVSAPQLRMGSSFDYIIQEEDESSEEYKQREEVKESIIMFSRYVVPKIDKEILEIKNVDSLVFKDGWLVDDDGDIEAPPHIELQIQQQMLLKPEIKQTRIRALVGGNRMVEIIRPPNKEIQEMIVFEVAQFWKSIFDNEPPAADFALDSEALRKLYGYAEPGKVLDATGDMQIKALVVEHQEAQAEFKAAESRKEAAKNELLTLIGNAEKVVLDGYSISAGVTGETFVEGYLRKSFRGMRIYTKKAK